MKTKGRGGRLVKSATVYTNDKKHPTLKLTMRGKVEKFVTITPKKVSLKGIAGQSIERSVRIIPKEKYPFRILETRARSGKDIRFNLKETEGSEYLLTVENLMKKKGRYRDTIYLKTDSKIKPEIRISVKGNISESKPEK